MSNVTIIDYGAGNMLNVVRALEYCGITPQVTQSAADIEKAERVIFPGVGAFGDCMAALRQLSLVGAIQGYIKQDRPFLGICVGMQVLFEEGQEFGQHEGLGAFSGKVVRIPEVGADGKPHKIPHIGWSRLEGANWAHSPLAPLSEEGAKRDVYFVHSFMGTPKPEEELAYTQYDGVHITAAVRRGNVCGVQFHPEKSGAAGLAILKGFLGL